MPGYGWIVGEVLVERTTLFNRKKYMIHAKIELDGEVVDAFYEVKARNIYFPEDDSFLD